MQPAESFESEQTDAAGERSALRGDPTTASRARIRTEILLVLGLSLGASAVYSIVTIVDRSTRSIPLARQKTTLNGALSDRQVFDLIYQFLGIFFDLVPVVLVA
ncbi:MAG TPA: hypothetical protein VN619_00395, partial [Lacisediminihabitans sp.]|nr:hypothetical protein [Lacisediminihabitans sp.]